ncbi:MAG: DUF4388 domain-containing protein [Gemmatimonadota bacterium]
MAIEGSLSDVNLADICQLLAMGRKSGCLRVTDRTNFGYIFFEKGRVTYASVLNRPDRLGELLVRNKIITRPQLSSAMESQAHHPGRRLGQLLVEQGYLTEEQLQRYVTIQIEEAVFHLFSWERGSFHFNPDQRPDEDPSLLVSINAEGLLLEGARRVDEWSVIEKKIPSMDLLFTLVRDPRGEGEVELTGEQGKLLPLLDGSRTVEELARDAGLVEFEAARGLYGLLQAGFAERSGRREAPPASDPKEEANRHLNLGTAFLRSGMLEDAEDEFKKVLHRVPDHPRAREKLGVLALKRGDPEGALKWLGEDDGKGSGAILRNRALALEMLGRIPEALEALEVAGTRRPDDAGVELARGVLQLRQGEPGVARQALQRHREMLGSQPPSALYFAMAVLASAMSGDLEEALTLGRDGLARHPTSGPLLVNLGQVLEQKGELAAAEALYLRATAEIPPPPQAHKNLGDLAYRRGDRAGARAHFERAVKLAPNLGDDVYLKLGTLAYREEDKDVALILWRRAVELNPENEVARSNLESLSAASGR